MISNKKWLLRVLVFTVMGLALGIAIRALTIKNEGSSLQKNEGLHTIWGNGLSTGMLIRGFGLAAFHAMAPYEMTKMVSPVALNFSGGIGSEKKGLGINVSLGLPQLLAYSERWELGVTYYLEDVFVPTALMEARIGKEQSLFGLISKKTTRFDSGETSQTVGEIRLGGAFLNIRTSNDVEGFGDGGDRFRSAALQMNCLNFTAGFNVGTGDPGQDLGVDRQVDTTIGGPFGTYVVNAEGKDPDKFRLGTGYLGLNALKVGINSEKLRAAIQNNFHRLIGSPDFKPLANFEDRPYFEFSIGGSTLWE